ncbi:hypothetical protein WKW80_09130 [Variovorax humicola]|uniref:Transmembrane protein n=1 Tax=Variovorax humicola TaxID=1769758 RepID=A0ABU8VYX8_9BURK
MTPQSLLAALGFAAMLLAASPALAGDGDHGDTPSAGAGPVLPRFATVSEIFELVGVLNGMHLTMYLDRFADNSPVKDARIELELGGAKVKVEQHGEGEFEAVLAELPNAGVLPVSATVVAGNERDLLTGQLDIHEAPRADAVAHRHGWKEIAGWVAGGLTALFVLGWGMRRLASARQRRAGGAA